MKKLFKRSLLVATLAVPMLLSGCTKSAKDEYFDLMSKNADNNEISMNIKLNKIDAAGSNFSEMLNTNDPIKIDGIIDRKDQAMSLNLKYNGIDANAVIANKEIYINGETVAPFIIMQGRSQIESLNGLIDTDKLMANLEKKIKDKLNGKYISIDGGEDISTEDFASLFETPTSFDFSKAKDYFDKEKFTKDGDKITLKLNKDDVSKIVSDIDKDIKDDKKASDDDKKAFEDFKKFWNQNEKNITKFDLETTMNTKEPSKTSNKISIDGKLNEDKVSIDATVDQDSKKSDKKVEKPSSSNILTSDEASKEVNKAIEDAITEAANSAKNDKDAA
ncbi:hypothetical protein BG262_05815 [Floricoccus penangensis]|uniref:Lipoprotein n=1 Tax=Floricoccus penangensis TaxID=1859475 RepID=A0A9Q5NYW3_9LACT|nr:hypothetical protein [Floricoccus penangensis]OFI46000.1 hypothetical protein BG262_05815 [Floricoccus penangensis]